jgi:uncharacterized protein (TIGR02246 family)
MTNQGTSTEVQAAIEAANEVFMATFNRGDTTALADLYTENGQLLPAGSDFVTGKEAIRNFWQGVMDMGIRSVNLESIEVEEHGDTSIDEGKYTLRGESGNVLDRGKYLVIWKQQAGQWKLHRDMWTSSLSPQGD